MAAGLAQLKRCAEDNFYQELESKTRSFTSMINSFCLENDVPLELISIGSIFWFSFNDKKRITASNQINPDMSSFNKMHHFLLNNGIYLGPSGYEVGFVSDKHSELILNTAAEKIIAGIRVFSEHK
jgi:glutamate-1-semialdehyde 2,1-aminomutase